MWARVFRENCRFDDRTLSSATNDQASAGDNCLLHPLDARSASDSRINGPNVGGLVERVAGLQASFTRSTNFCKNASKADLCTRIRCTEMQLWPE